MSTGSPAKADCPTTLEKCDKALTACDAALEARKKEVSLCNLALTQTLDQNYNLNLQLDDKNAELNKWYRNPFVVFALGVAAGIVVIEAVK